ncbi:MAG: DCC1-like thiol-disulfide oxidoreductase family protein [Gemmatimonadota bacterium]|nr:DCC1-like thiol-disulfide oxidoreductase family protein [Gemmatimonadota bacterium]
MNRTDPRGGTVLFDGDCRLCHAAARWIARRDPHGRFRLAFLDSAAGRAALSGAAVNRTAAADSVVLVRGGRAWTESGAALRIAAGLRPPWPLLAVLLLVPRPLRDAAYRFVARRRRRWFGEADRCAPLDPEVAARLLE